MSLIGYVYAIFAQSLKMLAGGTENLYLSLYGFLHVFAFIWRSGCDSCLVSAMARHVYWSSLVTYRAHLVQVEIATERDLTVAFADHRHRETVARLYVGRCDTAIVDGLDLHVAYVHCHSGFAYVIRGCDIPDSYILGHE